MKKINIYLSIFILISGGALLSCKTSEVVADNTDSKKTVTAVQKNTISDNKKTTTNTTIINNPEKNTVTTTTDTIKKDPVNNLNTKEVSNLETFENKIKNITLTITSKPKEARQSRAFTAPFVVTATDSQNKPVVNFSIEVSFPSGRTKGKLIFSKKTLTTDSNGQVSFLPEKPSFACSDYISFYPTPKSDTPELLKVAKEKEVKTHFDVRTNYYYKGGLISIVDYYQNGTPVTSNSLSASNILGELIRAGFHQIGNVDFTSQINKGTQADLYKAVKALVGNNYSYIIYGTVKYAEPMKKTSKGTSCTLIADITCLNIKDGSVLYKTTQKTTVIANSQWNALNNARKQLAEQVGHSLIYGM